MPPRPALRAQNPDEKSDEVFILGTLVSTDEKKEESKVKLKDGKELTVRSTDVSMANPVAQASVAMLLLHIP